MELFPTIFCSTNVVVTAKAAVIKLIYILADEVEKRVLSGQLTGAIAAAAPCHSCFNLKVQWIGEWRIAYSTMSFHGILFDVHRVRHGRTGDK